MSNEDVKERVHKHNGVHNPEKGSGEIGVPVVGKVKLSKETRVMVPALGTTNPGQRWNPETGKSSL